MRREWYESFFSPMAMEFWRAVVPPDPPEKRWICSSESWGSTAPDDCWICPVARAGTRWSSPGAGTGSPGGSLAGRAWSARGGSECAGSRAEFRVGDMRAPPAGPFDGACCLGNSIGYLSHEDLRGFLRATHARRSGRERGGWWTPGRRPSRCCRGLEGTTGRSRRRGFDKANRSSDKSYRGPGMDEGLRVLEKVRAELDVPVLTDVHDIPQIAPVAEVVDVLQTPAFLARQTDFIHAVAASGKPVNIKKAQFMAPHDMVNVVEKARSAAQAAGVNEDTIMVCERGASFGYNNLVSDMRSLAIMRETGCPSSSMRRTACSSPEGSGPARAASASSCRCLRGRRSRPASQGSSWRPTPIRRTPSPTDRTRGRWIAWKAC